MTISLNSSGESDKPKGLSLLNQSDTFTFAVIDIDNDVPVYKFGVEPATIELNHKGLPKKQIRLTVLAVSGDAVTGNRNDGYEPANAGDVYSIYIAGYAKWDPDQDKLGGTHLSWSTAVEGLPNGLRVGTVGQWKHLGELPSKAVEPRKNRKFALRAAKADEAAQTERCEQLHTELKQGVSLAVEPEHVEEPF